MGFTQWIRNSVSEVQKHGASGLHEITYQFYLGLLRRVYYFQNHEKEESIFDREWDVLIILDACRCDLIESIEDEYEFLHKNERFWSMGSMSREWMEANFSEEYANKICQTAYISGNVFTAEQIDPNLFYEVDEVWKYAWENGTVPARAITDRAINLHRRENPKKMILHYMQPHAPSVPDPLGEGMARPSEDDWTSSPELLRAGEISRERLVKSYRRNLRYVLDELSTLLKNINADKVVITADHGEAFGEYNVFGHPDHMPLQVLREVPWYETSATDLKTFEPSIKHKEQDSDISQKLRSLGYL